MPRTPPTYWEYIKIEEILSLQQGLAATEADLTNDEVMFITIHQIDELWFKLALRELVAVRNLFAAQHVPEQSLASAVRGLRRTVLLFKQVATHFELMETLTTRDYLAFRDKLYPASGFQSAQLREIEILMGLDATERIPLGHEDYLRALQHADGSESPASRRVRARLADRPSLREALNGWLWRTPIHGSMPEDLGDTQNIKEAVDLFLSAHVGEIEKTRVQAMADALTEHDRERLDARYRREIDSARAFLLAEDVEAPDERRRRVRIRAALMFIESYRELPLLAWPREILDSIVALEQSFVIFRQRHARMVERVIGRRTGTGGSAGVEYLDQTALRYRVFRDVWAVRTLLLRESALPPLSNPDYYGFAEGRDWGAAPRVVIVGGGTMGLAAAWAFARRGVAVELFERHGHVHEHGSHSGHTRAIRHAYHEGSDYVSLVVRADQEWTALGQRVGEQLLVRCGLLEFGPPDQPDFMAACQALRDHQIRHELLDAATTRARYGFHIPADWPACLAPDSGYLRVRPCLDALRREAEAHGAVLHHHVGVSELICAGPRARVQLDDGTRVDADHVVVAAGAWAAGLLGPAAATSPLRVLRRVMAWTRAEASVRARLRTLPVWATFVPEGFVYGFPDNDEGISGFKLACHASDDPSMNEPVDPGNVERTVGERDLAPLRAFIARYLPDAGEISATATCLYTNSETGDFWIDRHPADPRVLIAAGFSGHGFKFAPAIGLALAELTLDGHSELALARFRRPH